MVSWVSTPPYIVPDETRSYSAADLSAQVVLTNQLIADFISFGSDTSPYSGRPFFPISLVAELLSAGPNQFVLVETVEDAARWQIDVYGMRQTTRLNENPYEASLYQFPIVGIGQTFGADQSRVAIFCRIQERRDIQRAHSLGCDQYGRYGFKGVSSSGFRSGSQGLHDL
jgi:hypothetical protein